MSDYIVTVKYQNNPNHNPQQKIPGQCPLSDTYCTDVTGAHHSTLAKGFTSTEHVRLHYKTMGFHVTRVERIRDDF